jgi:hypothetical protein
MKLSLLSEVRRYRDRGTLAGRNMRARVAATKMKLLEMAANGEKTPNRKSPDKETRRLGHALRAYTYKNGSAYDLEFDIKIRAIRPDWFDPNRKNRVEEHKRKLLELANSGIKRPRINSDDPEEAQLGRLIASYIARSKDFREKLLTIRPDWFVEERVAAIKEKLLKWATDKEDRPSDSSKDPEEKSLASALRRYTEAEYSRCYDKVFDDKIRAMRPGWFNRVIITPAETKEQILALARSGKERPNSESDDPEEARLGRALNRFGYSSEPDNVDFRAEIDKIRPEWLNRRITAVIRKKEEILSLARSGAKRPNWKSDNQEEKKMGGNIRNYVNRTSQSYDPIFAAKLRAIRPDWFRKPQY